MNLALKCAALALLTTSLPAFALGYRVSLDPAKAGGRIASERSAPGAYALDTAVERIERHMNRVEPLRDQDGLTNAELAEKIATVAACFGLDPYVYAGLVHTESRYRADARSPTGAAGLTQMTKWGLLEVADQIGFGDSRRATETARLYFNAAIDQCIEVHLLAGAEWTPPWDRAEVARHKPYSPRWYRAQKDVLYRDPDSALIYGAVLLKTHLAVIRKSWRRSSTERVYREALRRYNGDEAMRHIYHETVIKTAKRIMRSR